MQIISLSYDYNNQKRPVHTNEQVDLERDQLVPNWPHIDVFGLWEEAGEPGEDQEPTGRTFKLHTERPQD